MRRPDFVQALFFYLFLCKQSEASETKANSRLVHKENNNRGADEPEQAVITHHKLFDEHSQEKLFKFWRRNNVVFFESAQTPFLKADWWRLFLLLPSGLREKILQQVFPFLINENEESIHCSNVYALCLEDNSCRSKYWNFLSSCSQSVEQISFQDWIMTSQIDKQLWVYKNTKTLKERRTVRSVTKNKNIKKNEVLQQKRKHYGKKSRKKRQKKRPTLFNQKRKSWKKMKAALHYWMGRFWPDIFLSSSSNFSQCSMECLNALNLLNNTVYGALLANCECKLNFNVRRKNSAFWSERSCAEHQRTVAKCRPRLHKSSISEIGCTEWRLKCENNPKCAKAQQQFFKVCSQVINGLMCTTQCHKAIIGLKNISKQFNSCVCDGNEKPYCLKIKSHMRSLCFLEQKCQNKLNVPLSQNIINIEDEKCEEFLKKTLPDLKNTGVSFKFEINACILAICFFVVRLMS